MDQQSYPSITDRLSFHLSSFGRHLPDPNVIGLEVGADFSRKCALNVLIHAYVPKQTHPAIPIRGFQTRKDHQERSQRLRLKKLHQGRSGGQTQEREEWERSNWEDERRLGNQQRIGLDELLDNSSRDSPPATVPRHTKMVLAGIPGRICIPYTFMIYLFYSEQLLINWLTSSFLGFISFASFLALASLRLAARRALRSVSRRS